VTIPLVSKLFVSMISLCSESNRVKTLAVLEFDDLLGLEKPYVSLLHQWNNKIRWVGREEEMMLLY
jgi:hypothetical protein